MALFFFRFVLLAGVRVWLINIITRTTKARVIYFFGEYPVGSFHAMLARFIIRAQEFRP